MASSEGSYSREAPVVAALEGQLHDSTNRVVVRQRDGTPVVGTQQGGFSLVGAADASVPNQLLFSILSRTASPAEAQAEWARVAASLKAMRYFASEAKYTGVRQFIDGYFAAMREPVPAMHCPYWFGAAGPQTWLVPGKINVALDVGELTETSHAGELAVLRRLHERYGD